MTALTPAAVAARLAGHLVRFLTPLVLLGSGVALGVIASRCGWAR